MNIHDFFEDFSMKQINCETITSSAPVSFVVKIPIISADGHDQKDYFASYLLFKQVLETFNKTIDNTVMTHQS